MELLIFVMMLSTPWSLPSCTLMTLCARSDGCNDVIESNVFEQLENSKDAVFMFKLRHGNEAWKLAVEAIDTNVRMSITIDNPVSRAYFKLTEIIRTCAIPQAAKSFHMCEAPGGFVQAVFEEFNNVDVHCSSKIGEHNACFSPVIKRQGATIHTFQNNDILNEEIRMALANSIGMQSCQLITADGANDNDLRPDMVEEDSAMLIASEIKLASTLQAPGGCFVLKVFGLRLHITWELIATLCHMYTLVQIVKPFTSRVVNDERYVVCSGFKIEKKIDLHLPIGSKLTRLCKLDTQWFEAAKEIAIQMAYVQHRHLQLALCHTSNIPRGRRIAGRGRSRGRGGKGGVGKRSF